jgi:peptidoglycan DL-endopeptidase RipA
MDVPGIVSIVIATAGAAAQGAGVPPAVVEQAANVADSAVAVVQEQLPAEWIEQLDQQFPEAFVGPQAPPPGKVDGSTAPTAFETTPTPAAVVPPMVGIPGVSAPVTLTFDPRFPRNLDLSRAVVEQAMWAIGLPYQWGGGTLTGPSLGDGSGGAIAGFDCSALVRFAYYVASHGTIVLPRTSQEQFRAGKQITLDQAQPGDLLFGNWQADGANHVAMYLGDNTMIEAPQRGQLVQISAVRSDMIAARFL